MGSSHTHTGDPPWQPVAKSWALTEEIYQTYHPQIYGYIHRRLPVDAEDLTADVFTRALVAEHNGHGPHTTVRGWLFRIAKSVISDYARRSARRPEPMHLERIETLPEEEDNYEYIHLQMLLDQAAAPLSYRHAALLQLKLDGWTNHQLADLFGLKHVATRQLLLRARASLRRTLTANTPSS